MRETTTEITNKYIEEHPDIRSCLKKKLINYSSLARLIAKDLRIEKSSSKEAILIAARRFQEKLKSEIIYEKNIKSLLANSEIEIKNKISVYIIEKNVNFKFFDEMQKPIKKDGGIFYLLEGSNYYTIITQEKYTRTLNSNFSEMIIAKHENEVLIILKSSKEIEYTSGIISYLTSLFTEHGVNIIEIFSFWTDTLFIIKKEDVNRSMEFLKF